MAIVWKCFLNDFLLDTEPINLSSLAVSLIRDEEMHGIGAEATTETIEFTGNAIGYLDAVKSCDGLKADVVFKAMKACGPNEEFETIIEGKLNVSDRKKKCGNVCTISVPMETVTCETLMNNRLDQPVDMDKNVSFDGMTALDIYEDMNFPIQLPTRELPYKTEGFVIADEPSFVIGPTSDPTKNFIVRPDFANVIANNIHVSSLTGAQLIGFLDASIISPVVLFDERKINFPIPIVVTGRLKGRLTLDAGGDAFSAALCVFRGEIKVDDFNFGAFIPATQYETIATQVLQTVGVDPPTLLIDFDFSFGPYDWDAQDTGADGIYVCLEVSGGFPVTYNIQWGPETTFKAETIKAVPPTYANAYMIHETLSRCIEAITDRCARVKSSYYGRVDSQPFSFPSDGCGGLRALMSGLKMRNASPANFTPNPRDLIKDLQCIDNIGMGIEPDPFLPGRYVLRIEDLDFFYRDQEILRCPLIPEGDFDVEAARSYSVFKIGYKKWETQANFGLDEFNGPREYRTSLTSIKNILDKQSGLIAGEYAIEITREQQFAETNAADTKYDDDTFIICLTRLGGPYGYGYSYAYGGMVVEQIPINFPNNIFSPNTTYNYRISPARNLLRWFRSIMAGYQDIYTADNKIFFTKGSGNYSASGELSDDYLNDCVLEGLPIAENQDIAVTLFKDPIAKATPLWRNETFTYDYPLSIADYKKIKANPYGYISFQCGKGQWDKGWIKEIKYRLVAGLATFVLRRKWKDEPCLPIPVSIDSESGPTGPTAPPPPEAALRLLFDDIGNVPVADASSVSDWNTFFDTGINAASPFTSVVVIGNEVQLSGATDLSINADLFNGNINLISIIDETNEVIEIEANGFINATGLTTVTLPAVTTLGNFAFQGCTGLTSISFPLVTTAGQQAFAFCTNLGTVNLPLLSIVPPSCFASCSNLADISSLENVTEIQSNAFADCVNMTPPTFNNLNVDVGILAFQGCTLMNSFSAPLLINIESEAFENCTALTDIYIPSCTNLGGTTGDDNVFLGIGGNTMTVTIPTATATDGDIVTLQSFNTVTLILV